MSILIERVSLTNFKSIAHCDVAFRPLTVVVGRNGSGKSNFLDSLHFVADALQTTLEYAIRRRGGLKGLIHRRGEQRLAIALAFRLGGDRKAQYFLRLERGRVAIEDLTIETNQGEFLAGYARRGTSLKARIAGETSDVVPSVLHDRLALVALSGTDDFRGAYDALTAMRFYHLNPDVMREPQDPHEGEVLAESGSNISSVWGRLSRTNPDVTRRLTSFLAVIVPELNRVRRVRVGTKEGLRFHQGRAKGELQFEAASMSDGTLRALGVLIAASQENGSRSVSTLSAIEEPEIALHPEAVAALMDALHEASATKTQIIVTSHSPDVLDQVDMLSDTLLVTEFREGATVVDEVDETSREAIRRHLYTPGDLLRMDQLQPRPASE